MPLAFTFSLFLDKHVIDRAAWERLYVPATESTLMHVRLPAAS